MTAVAFDTLRFVKTLEAAGIEPKQAEALATAQREALVELVEAREPVSKYDLEFAVSNLRHDLELAMNKLKTDLQQEMATMRFEILRWVVGLAIGQAALMIGLALKLAH